jgi:two-component system sensor histidine kinase AlgZ
MALNGGPLPGPEKEFFVPDLCAPWSVLILFLLAELLVVVFVLLGSELPQFNWVSLAVVSLFVQWVVLLTAAILCASRDLLARQSVWLGVLASFLIILLVTLFSSLVAREVFPDAARGELPNGWIFRNLLVALLIGGMVLRYFYLQQELRVREQAELTARLNYLRARIRPHFLFNTMNSIASLISSRPAEAEQAVEDLSELFRASLVEGEQESTLADELHLCRLYLRIEQLRLGDRLDVHWQVDEQLLRSSMPALVLQPLVENAVHHGVSRLPEGGTVEISVARLDGKLQVQVLNPVPPGEEPSAEGHQMAQENIQQRLLALFGEQSHFAAGISGGRYRVLFSYPLREAM